MKGAVLWTWWNGLSDGLWTARPDVPIARIRYETLTKFPEDSFRSIRDKLLPRAGQ